MPEIDTIKWKDDFRGDFVNYYVIPCLISTNCVVCRNYFIAIQTSVMTPICFQHYKDFAPLMALNGISLKAMEHGEWL